jgi:MinD-like ATPase involved in chromosome partitioning or flagellar assembly
MSDTPAEKPRHGRIITFYSYKGGTGRTMALANVAWILAANGHRVLVADWDLESPGLHRFLNPFLAQVVRDATGIIDMVRDYEWVAARADEDERRLKHIAEHARVERYAVPVNWSFAGGGALEFLSPGRQNRNYMATINAMNWDDFYDVLNGGEFIDAMRDDMKRHYDYVLIDSRTGFSDVSDICTVQLPDVLVDCFALSTQAIDGAAQVAREIEARYPDRDIRIFPVPMRIEVGEQERVEASLAYAFRTFAGLPAEMSDAQRRAYWGAVEVPYRPFYAFEETLAIFGDKPNVPGSLLSAYERITSFITSGAVTRLPALDDDLRESTRLRFVRRPQSDQITLEFVPEDEIWAEWIAAVLGEGGFTVHERRLEGLARSGAADTTSIRTVTVVSGAYLARRRGQLAGTVNGDLGGQARPLPVRPGYAVYVTAARSLPEFSPASSVFIAGERDEEAARQLRQLLSMPSGPAARRSPAIRYPGDEPKVLRVGARNDGFTGRERDLRDLREQLRSYDTAVIRPITLHGTAGVGKTQVALEYVHRFKNDYDLVWWIDCGESAAVDVRVAELAPRMREMFGISLPAGATVEELAGRVLNVLSQGHVVPRWLLVYDNAEDIETIRDYLPSAGGHVLITSQNTGWTQHGSRFIPIELFKREESVAHLLRVAPSLRAGEADQVAEALGDLPLAVATAAAYLSSGYPVSQYLNALEREAASALSVSQLTDYPQGVLAAWEPSMQHLRERSPAAARLMELFSVMAAEISLDIIYDPVTISRFVRYEPRLSEPMFMPRVIQEVAKLSLIKLDVNAHQVHVHRIVQAVIRSRMKPEELDAARAEVQQILVGARPSLEVDDPGSWTRYGHLWPHLAPSLVVTSDDNAVRQLIIDRVRYIWVRNDFDRGRDEAIAAEEHWRTKLAATSDAEVKKTLQTQLLQLRFTLANIRRSQAQYQEARSLDEDVLGEQTDLLGADHPHVLMTAGSLAADLRALGLYREALDRDKETHPAWLGLYGAGNRRTLAAANNLAVSYRLNGHMAAALELDLDTFEQAQATLGPGHLLTLLMARNVVRDMLEAGDYRAAVSRMKTVHPLCVSFAGADSAAALDAQVLLGVALRSAGWPAEAQQPFGEALLRLTDRFGETSSEALACRLSQAINLGSLDQFAAAEEGMRPVLEEYDRQLGSSHPHTLVCQVNLASALRLTSRQDEAIRMIVAAMDELALVLGPQHPYTLAAAMVYGVLLADHGDLDRAAEVEARTVRSMTVTLGDAHPDTLRCRANLLLTRQQQGEPAAAAERKAVIAQLENLIGVDHPNISALRGERRLVRALDPQPF